VRLRPGISVLPTGSRRHCRWLRLRRPARRRLDRL